MQVIGTTVDELTLLSNAPTRGDSFDVLKHRRGHIGEYYLQGRAESLDRTKRNETVPGAYIYQRGLRLQLSRINHPVCNNGRERPNLMMKFGIARVTQVQQPFGPRVRLCNGLTHTGLSHWSLELIPSQASGVCARNVLTTPLFGVGS
ncbi:hypothetical protein LMG28138_05748 [Pararobbsia alpina]|uniref:Uncharacterized protein n=1 Tax=Pararobbsia alpina TaxID=621374 RepID=A0A6S7BN07_9BURK|nr:hypothetical protein LMG28138_05748 [Pararobbsia alpina]